MDFSATRREFLAALGWIALAPAAPAAPAASRVPLRSLLDRVAAAGEPGAMLTLVRRASVDGLGRVESEILRMVARGLEREVALRRAFPSGKPDGSSPYVVSQRHGAWLELDRGDLSSQDKAARLDGETARLRSDAGRRIVPPAFILDSAIEAQAELQGKADREVRSALFRQTALLRELRAGALPAPGVWQLPDGEEYYRLRLRCASGLDDPPARIEQGVAAATSALLGRADRLLGGLGLTRGTVGERLRALKARPEHVYPDDDAGRTRAVAGMNAALARIRPRLGEWFDSPFDAGGAVQRMTAADERSGRRGYRDPAAGLYYPDLAQVRERPAWTLTTVAYHETFPGHLLQLSRQASADPHPLQSRYAPGYPEGWAIYAEALVDSAGLLSPAGQLGFIQSLLFRLARVTCDIGIHLRRWDRPRALRYLEDTVGFELFFPFAVEVDRYAAEPGAFAGDAVVALTLRRLGRRAAQAGRLRAFHGAVLNHGPLSAEAMERIV